MAFFSKEEVVLFSPMEGVITYEGQPAEGAEVVRQVTWKNDETRTDRSEADENGQFSFPVITDSDRQVLPTQFVAHQRVYVNYRGEEYVIWMMGKISTDLYGELGGKPSNFRCELTSDLRRVEGPYSGLGTMCKWDEIE